MGYGGGGGGSGGGGSGGSGGSGGASTATGTSGGHGGTSARTITFMGDRAVRMGGDADDTIEYFSMATVSGSATDFGELVTAVNINNAASNGFRGTFFGGNNPPPATTNTIEYITIGVTGDALDFGDLASLGSFIAQGETGVRGFRDGGSDPGAPGRVNTIEYWTISTAGSNALDFGDDTIYGQEKAGMSSIGRQCFAGAYGGPTAPTTNRDGTISFVNGDVNSNAKDFGDITEGKSSCGGASDGVRGLISHGYPTTNEIDYITIVTAGNALEFGDQTIAKETRRGAGNGYRVFWVGGFPGADTIDWCTVQTLGNCVDWGDLATSGFAAATSGN